MHVDRLVLYPARLKSLAFAVVCAAFTAIGAWMVADGEAKGWFVASFFGLGSIVFVVNVLPSASSLTLDPRGLTVRTLFRQRSYEWSEIACFGVHELHARTLVCFDFHEGHPKRRPFGSSLLGAMDIALPDTYGQWPDDLALLLEDWRSGQRRTPDVPHTAASLRALLARGVSGHFGLLWLKLTALLSFCGGPLYLSDHLTLPARSTVGFAVVFAPVAVLMFGALSLGDGPSDRFAVWSVRVGLAGACALVAMNVYTLAMLATNAERGSWLTLLGIGVGFVATVAYARAARPFLRALPDTP